MFRGTILALSFATFAFAAVPMAQQQENGCAGAYHFRRRTFHVLGTILILFLVVFSFAVAVGRTVEHPDCDIGAFYLGLFALFISLIDLT